ncbi:MAG: caspase domain-containing protein [Planctomycetaceae bacterium]
MPLAKNIREQFELLLSELKPDDTLLVAFSGHGVQFKGEPTVFFCPADTKLSDRSTLVSLTAIYDLLADPKKCRASAKVLLVDACRNDPQTMLSKTTRKEIELDPAGITDPPVPPGGIAAFFSCSAGQQSYEHPNLQHGVFLNFVIEPLSGRGDLDNDQEVSLAELEQYTTKQTQRFVRVELGKSQTPERKGEARGVVSLSRITNIAPALLVAPFAATAARTAQECWAKSLGGKVEETNSIGMKLTLIPAGEFQMGSSDADVRRVHQSAQRFQSRIRQE